ncbi:MAG TPA: glycoside hydrolase family 97 catalytic domain-containing protein, partial [Gemmatimonadaceae bacterium]|nr:glycoside hydrolase family 97 catalytic domain-containing protein [Gemmatimonadaceae bacterium]
SIHEAALVDYAAYWLKRQADGSFRTTLSPSSHGARVIRNTPFTTPWRTIRIADNAAGLVENDLELNLNEPNKLGDVSWIHPSKYIGIWWGMISGRWSWAEGPTHGATTARTRQYIDFAAKHGFRGVLVEGWNRGWNGDWFGHGDEFSFTKAVPDFDLPALAAYAKSKGVHLIGHHETGGNIANYEPQLDAAFAQNERMGIEVTKTGYVADLGGIIAPGDKPGEVRMEYHDGQRQVEHHLKVVETAAKYQIAVDVHEPIHDTGERRTWPNMLSREGARGQEYNAWGGEGGNPPEHESILFFTRMLSGPMDFTPGIFDLLIKRQTGKPRSPDEPRPRSTLAKQLALYVVLYSPVQMAADLIENYDRQPAFQFIRDVAVDWDTTRVLAGRIGDYVAVARKTKSKDEWFVGAITDEAARTLDLPLSFLPNGRRYVAQIYADAPNASWRENPEAIRISSQPVTSATRLHVVFAPGGGQAIRLIPAP